MKKSEPLRCGLSSCGGGGGEDVWGEPVERLARAARRQRFDVVELPPILEAYCRRARIARRRAWLPHAGEALFACFLSFSTRPHRERDGISTATSFGAPRPHAMLKKIELTTYSCSVLLGPLRGRERPKR